MSAERPFSTPDQQGSALLAALFLIVVVATLGIFAVRLQSDQQQTATLQVLEYRGDAAAHAGLEYWSARIAANPAVTCASASLSLNGFVVTTSCVQISTGLGNVYVITSDARSGTFGSPDFVRRQLTRQVSPTSAVYE